jgi:hypothetical protein
MPGRSVWIPRLLLGGSLTVAGGLIGLVLLSPLVPADGQGLGQRVLALFCRDATLRRTALGCGLGLGVSGWVFFRPASSSRSAARKAARMPPRPIAGA